MDCTIPVTSTERSRNLRSAAVASRAYADQSSAAVISEAALGVVGAAAVFGQAGAVSGACGGDISAPALATANIPAIRHPDSANSITRGGMRCRLPHRRHRKADRDTSFPHFVHCLCDPRTGYGA